MSVRASQQVRKMRGGAQSHLMFCEDGFAYVVKFQNNPQHLRVLANEMIATRLADALGLTVPACDVVEVSKWLVDNTRELSVEIAGRSIPCSSGMQFGSRLMGGLMPGNTVDYLPEEQLSDVKNVAEFAGVLVLDKWTCNSNGRQAVFHRKSGERRYRAAFIDQGFCFHAGAWTFIDAPLQGVYARHLVYRSVAGWESFEPWMNRMEALDSQAIWRIVQDVPLEWYDGSISEMEQLIELLIARRSRVRELVESFRGSSRQPFPNWP